MTHIIKLAELEQRVGLTRTSIYKLIHRGEFPAPVRLLGRASGWLAAWEAMSNSGVDTYSHTLEDDSEVAVTALRNAIRVAGVKWAERNGLRWLASAFLCIRVERGQMFYEPGLAAAEIVFELPA